MAGGSGLRNWVSSWTTSQVQVTGEFDSFDCSRTHGNHSQLLGHQEVAYYSDNEPTACQILKLLVTERSAIGLQTRMKTTKLYDSAGNALVENAIQRIRAVAATLMEAIVEEIGLRFNNQHPLWTWCCRHAAWTLNRFQVLQGTTSYELVFGRSNCAGLVRLSSPTPSTSKVTRLILGGRLEFVWAKATSKTLG